MISPSIKSKSVEIIPCTVSSKIERLYWISDIKPPTNVSNSFYFNIDDVFFMII